jgi:hypothetical protein
MGFFAALYGLACYACFLGSFLYAIGFVGDFAVPKTIDSGPAGAWPEALLIDLVLLGLFAVQHSVMARPGFKAVWTRIVPRAVERSTYVLFSSLLLILLMWKWQAIPAVVWDVSASLPKTILLALCAVGWLIVEDLVSSGTTVRLLTQLVEGLGGQVIGIGALWRRTKKAEIDGKEIFSLVSRDFPTYPPETCPLCKKGIPLNQEFVKRREHRRPSHAQEHV